MSEGQEDEEGIKIGKSELTEQSEGCFLSEGQEDEEGIKIGKSELTEQSEGCFLSARARR